MFGEALIGPSEKFELFRKKCVDWGYGTASLWDFVTISYNHKNTVPL